MSLKIRNQRLVIAIKYLILIHTLLSKIRSANLISTATFSLKLNYLLCNKNMQQNVLDVEMFYCNLFDQVVDS